MHVFPVSIHIIPIFTRFKENSNQIKFYIRISKKKKYYEKWENSTNNLKHFRYTKLFIFGTIGV